MNSANLIKIENFEDKEKIKDLEIAAEEGRVDIGKILEIYKKIPFDLNSLINAEDVVKSLDLLIAELYCIKNTFYLTV